MNYNNEQWLSRSEITPIITDCCAKSFYKDGDIIKCRGCEQKLCSVQELIDLHNEAR